MAEAITRPWESEYTIEKTETLAETPELRVLRITLAPGEFIPWHYHSGITDRFACLEGELEVETRAPRHSYRMGPGGECEVPPKTAHTAVNKGPGRCRFLVVQGVGAYDYRAVGR